MRFLRSLKCSRSTWNSLPQPVELTQKLTTETTASHSLYIYVVPIVGHYYTVIFGGF